MDSLGHSILKEIEDLKERDSVDLAVVINGIDEKEKVILLKSLVTMNSSSREKEIGRISVWKD
jgi:hypothetical protein